MATDIGPSETSPEAAEGESSVRDLPFSGTTSEGDPTVPRVPRKIKPPSASFLKAAAATSEGPDSATGEDSGSAGEGESAAGEAAADPDGAEPDADQAAAATDGAESDIDQASADHGEADVVASGEAGHHDTAESEAPPAAYSESEDEILGAADGPTHELGAPDLPAEEELGAPGSSGDASELAGPAPVEALEEPDPAETGEASAPQQAGPSGVAAGPGSELSAERAQAELKELEDIVNSLDALKFLKPRLARSLSEGVDATTLVSFYRLVARSLKDEAASRGMAADAYKREMEKLRTRVGQMEKKFGDAVEMAKQKIESELGGGAGGKEVQERLKNLESELDRVNEQREKLLVDFKNMRERAQRDSELKLFREKEKFFRNFLPVLDSFERAHQTLHQADLGTVVEGFRIIFGQLNEALEGEGLAPVDTSGLFDPRFHEAIGEVECEDKQDDAIFDELSKGYMLGERLIRPAMVRVARNRSGAVPGAGPAAEEPPAEASGEQAAPEPDSEAAAVEPDESSVSQTTTSESEEPTPAEASDEPVESTENTDPKDESN